MWSREGEGIDPEGDHREKVGDKGVAVVDPEVLERPLRRKYTAEYKLRALEEAERRNRPGELGRSLMRGQGERSVLDALSPKRMGRKAKVEDPKYKGIRELERENLRLEECLKHAERMIEFPKKLTEILRMPLEGNQGLQ